MPGNKSLPDNNPAFAGVLIEQYMLRALTRHGVKPTPAMLDELKEIPLAFYNLNRRLAALEKHAGMEQR